MQDFYHKHRTFVLLIVVGITLEVTERSLDYFIGDNDGTLTHFFIGYLITFYQISIIPIYLITLGLKHKLITVLVLWITLFVGLIAVELFARYFTTKNKVLGSHYHELLEKEDFLQKDQLIRDLAFIHGDKVKDAHKYYDHYLFSEAPKATELVNYTDYYSARNVPNSESREHANRIIWLFGGSTMQGTGTTDSLSIANQIAIYLHNANKPSAVINFGTVTFQSTLELIKMQDLLKKVAKDEYPDYVVFYNGYNDAANAYAWGAGSVHGDVSKHFAAIVERDFYKQFMNSVNGSISKISVFWKYYLSSFITKNLYIRVKVDDSEANLLKAVSVYKINVRTVKAICSEFQIVPIFILQPMLYTKNKLTEMEQEIHDEYNEMEYTKGLIKFMSEFHKKVGTTLQESEGFYDLSDILNKSSINNFYDIGHTGPTTGPVIGEAIGKILESNIIKLDMASME